MSEENRKFLGVKRQLIADEIETAENVAELRDAVESLLELTAEEVVDRDLSIKECLRILQADSLLLEIAQKRWEELGGI